MAVLKVSPDKLRLLTEELLAMLDQSKELNKQLQENLNYLNSAWEGEELSDLMLQLNEAQQIEEKKHLLIRMLIEQVTKAAHTYSQSENEVIAPLLNLDTEVIE